jgi:phage portal protein BeeE
MAIPNLIQDLLSRIARSGLGVDYQRVRHAGYLKARQDWWQSNSIYLDNIYNKIATDVAMISFRHVRITRRDGEPDVWKWYEQSDLADVVGFSPNRDETPVVFWSNVIRRVLEDGVAVVVPTYEGGSIKSITLVDGAGLTSDKGRLLVSLDGELHEVEKSDVWIFENPKKNLTAQLGQITRLIDDNLRALNDKLNEQPTSLRGLLKFPTRIIDEELRKKTEDRLENIFASARRGGIGYLQAGEEFQELANVYSTASESEMDFLKGQLYQAFGINEKLFTCDYGEEQYRAYYQSVVRVYIRVIGEEINRKHFTATARTQGHRLLVYMDLFNVASLKDLNEFAFRQKYTGNLNSNEIREIFGYAAYAGGDTYETNANAVRITSEGGAE